MNGVTVKFEEDQEDTERHQPMLEDEEMPMTAAQRMVAECKSKTIDLKHRFWQAWLITGVGDDVEKLTQELDVLSLNDTADAVSVIWMRYVANELNEDSIQYEAFDEQAINKFHIQQAWFDNIDYQREDLEESCELLGIPWSGSDTVYRMQGMAISVQFHFWQPVVHLPADLSVSCIQLAESLKSREYRLD